MSAADIIRQLPRLSEADRRAVVAKLRELAQQAADIRACDETARAQAAALDHMEEEEAEYRAVDLRARGIGEAQAADLRSRLSTFAEDWNRPEMDIYDANPAR
jgi:hypothetical protein